jgi:hypothetical protein
MVFRSGVRMRPILDLEGAGEFNIHAGAAAATKPSTGAVPRRQ